MNRHRHTPHLHTDGEWILLLGSFSNGNQKSPACIPAGPVSPKHEPLAGVLPLIERPQKANAALNPNPRFLRNFPMQANGAEMLRLACCLAVESGIKVCAPVHDAILIEAPIDDIENASSTTQALMADASSLVLDGFRLGSDAKVIKHPDRYMDERGTHMWDTVWDILRDRIPCA